MGLISAGMTEKGAKIFFNNLRMLKEVSVCDLRAYVLNKDKEELILESVNHVRSEGGEVVLRNLFGEEKRIRGEVREVSLAKNRILVVPR